MTTQTTTAATAQLTGDYRIDPIHSRIGFVARHAMVTKVRGEFNEFEGEGHFDADDPGSSSIRVVIESESIDTRSEDRDAHLRSNDFLAMAEHPQIEFTSTAIEPSGSGVYEVTGDLTLRGVRRSVTFDMELTGSAVDPYGNQRVGLEGSLVINRKDWGVNWNAPLEAGGVLVGEKVTIEFDVSAVKQTS